MSKVHLALEEAERRRREGNGDRRALTDPAAQTAPAYHRPSDPVSLREYERLVAKISHARAEAFFKTLMVVAPAHGGGTSTVCLNLAVAFGDRGLNVLLLDANLRRPDLHGVFHLPQSVGLTDVIAETTPWTTAVRETDHARVRLVTAGSPTVSPASLFETERFAKLLEHLRNSFDLVILDGPPVLPYADALVLSAKAERVILVVRSEETPVDHLQRAKAELERNGAVVLGIVLNRKKSYGPLRLQPFLTL